MGYDSNPNGSDFTIVTDDCNTAYSLGMGCEKSETWTIYSIKDGESEVFAEY